MSTIIIYATKYGSVEKCAKMLAEKIGGDVRLVNIEKDDAPCLECAENVIIGGSIYAGSIQKSIRNFSAENLKALLPKRIGLFVCAAEREDPRKTEQIDRAFPSRLREKAVSIECFGDEITWEKLSGFHKLMMKIIAKKSESYSNIDESAIDRMAEKISLIKKGTT
ncbi:MAG TPA: flavodoxin [candidate division Zixibacteria bacterium]|nr:flavodoxin [candidate division Zixibacteria bacterium]